jgi:hypothetical protein
MGLAGSLLGQNFTSQVNRRHEEYCLYIAINIVGCFFLWIILSVLVGGLMVPGNFGISD